MTVVDDAIENAASANNKGMRPGFPNVSDDRVFDAREIIRRFLGDVPPEMTAFEMLQQIEG